jgi:hypothetical protein
MQGPISQEQVDAWFDEEQYPSPTGFALSFGIHPGELRSRAEADDVVELALYRIIAGAESRLYKNVYGPKAMIQRVELFLPVQTVDDAELEEEVRYVG